MEKDDLIDEGMKVDVDEGMNPFERSHLPQTSHTHEEEILRKILKHLLLE